MEAITYSWARNHLAQTIDKLCDNHDPMIFTKKNERSAVLISLEDYQSLEETAYLLRSPVNVKRLMDSVAELESGLGKEQALIE